MTTTGQTLRSQLVSPAAVDAMAGELRPVIDTDHHRWIECHSPRYNASGYDWRSHNVAFFGEFESGLPPSGLSVAPTDQPITL